MILILLIALILYVSGENNKLYETVKNDYKDTNVIKNIIDISVGEGDFDNAYVTIIYLNNSNRIITNKDILYQKTKYTWLRYNLVKNNENRK